MRKIRIGYIALLFLLSSQMMGCMMSGMPVKAPKASDTIQIPSGTEVESIFSCAETVVQELAGTDDRWDPRITRRDVSAGVFETSNYPEENESGFRVKLSFKRGDDSALLEVKGAGAYFVDLGVEDAMTVFKSKLSACIAA